MPHCRHRVRYVHGGPTGPLYGSCCQHHVVLDVIVVMVVDHLVPPLYVSDSQHHIEAVVDQVAACAPLYVSGCGQATRPVTLVEVFTVTGKINLLGQILSTRSISLSPCSQILSPARQNIVQKLHPCSQILSPHVKRRVTLTFILCCLLRSSAFVYVSQDGNS